MGQLYKFPLFSNHLKKQKEKLFETEIADTYILEYYLLGMPILLHI